MNITTVELSYEEFGSRKNPPLVILHGFFAASRNWRQIARGLAQNNHVFVLDLRNHGSSPHAQTMDYPSMAADLLAFFDRHDIQNANLLGHSMGGKVAMWFALNWPERIEKLIIVDIAPVSYRHSFNSIIQAIKELPLDKISNRRQAETYLTSSIPDLRFRQFMLQNLVLVDGEYRWRIDLNIFAQSSPSIIAFPDTRQLSPFSRQSLFLLGSNSQHVQPEYHAKIAMLFPDSLFQTIPETGHWPHAEQPEQFLAAVSQFLQ